VLAPRWAQLLLREPLLKMVWMTTMPTALAPRIQAANDLVAVDPSAASLSIEHRTTYYSVRFASAYQIEQVLVMDLQFSHEYEFVSKGLLHFGHDL